MWTPFPLRRLGRLTSWHLDSHQVAHRNAMVASTILADRRRERVEVEEFLAALPHRRAATHGRPPGRATG